MEEEADFNNPSCDDGTEWILRLAMISNLVTSSLRGSFKKKRRSNLVGSCRILKEIATDFAMQNPRNDKGVATLAMTNEGGF